MSTANAWIASMPSRTTAVPLRKIIGLFHWWMPSVAIPCHRLDAPGVQKVGGDGNLRVRRAGQAGDCDLAHVVFFPAPVL